MTERVKKTKCRGAKNLRGWYAGEGKEDKMRGGGGLLRIKFKGGYTGEGKKYKMQGLGCCEKIKGGGMPERVKKTKCGDGLQKNLRGGGCCDRNLRGGGMTERVKKTKCRGCEKNEGGGYAGEGKADKMRGCEQKLRGVCCKCGGGGGEGVLRKTFEGGGYAGEGKEDKMRGGGDHKKNLREVSGKLCLLKGGSDIKWNSPL